MRFGIFEILVASSPSRNLGTNFVLPGAQCRKKEKLLVRRIPKTCKVYPFSPASDTCYVCPLRGGAWLPSATPHGLAKTRLTEEHFNFDVGDWLIVPAILTSVQCAAILASGPQPAATGQTSRRESDAQLDAMLAGFVGPQLELHRIAAGLLSHSGLPEGQPNYQLEAAPQVTTEANTPWRLATAKYATCMRGEIVPCDI